MDASPCVTSYATLSLTSLQLTLAVLVDFLQRAVHQGSWVECGSSLTISDLPQLYTSPFPTTFPDSQADKKQLKMRIYFSDDMSVLCNSSLGDEVDIDENVSQPAGVPPSNVVSKHYKQLCFLLRSNRDYKLPLHVPKEVNVVAPSTTSDHCINFKPPDGDKHKVLRADKDGRSENKSERTSCHSRLIDDFMIHKDNLTGKTCRHGCNTDAPSFENDVGNKSKRQSAKMGQEQLPDHLKSLLKAFSDIQKRTRDC